VAGEELRLFFMPIVDAAPDGGGAGSVRLSGAEALVRWEHPRLGLLPPGAFLLVADETGLMPELDLWAVAAAIAVAASWGTDDGSRCTSRSTSPRTRSWTRGSCRPCAPP
jgi:EAL domain-containing protein (putative c-di-GMP-specific phosphodiesterase class I)